MLRVHQRVALALSEQLLTEVAAKEARPARNQRYQGSCLFFARLLLATPNAPVTEARLYRQGGLKGVAPVHQHFRFLHQRTSPL
jgi:hypothetical protein